MKRAPVARARARLATASHRMFTPNGTRISDRSAPIAAAIAAGISGPTRELVRVVGLVAEHDPVDARLLEDRQVAADDVDQVARSGGHVVARASRQAGEVEHRDHWLRRPEDPLERVHRSLLNQVRHRRPVRPRHRRRSRR